MSLAHVDYLLHDLCVQYKHALEACDADKVYELYAEIDAKLEERWELRDE